jgi:AraC family L-rhamnose operon transcriptional activator RhaR
MADSDAQRAAVRPLPADASRIRAEATYRAQQFFAGESVPVLARVGLLAGSDDYPPHAHEDFIEIVVVAEGVGRHVAAHGWTTLAPGRVVVVRPGAWHAFSQTPHVRAATICISTRTLSSDLSFLRARTTTRDLLYSGPIGPSAKGVWTTEVPDDVVADVIVETERLSETLATRPDDTLVVLGGLISVLGRLAKGIPGDGVRLGLHPGVVAVLEALEAAPDHPWTVPELAGLVRLNGGYLSRLFRDAVGVPPIAYLARLRVERAAGLLASTEISVKDIGAQVGWSDPTYFYRRFHALIGMSPRDYRREIRTGIASPAERPLPH